VWASEFCRIFAGFVVGGTGPYGLEEGTMVGWFANAIEVGRVLGRLEGARLIESMPTLFDEDDRGTEFTR
jgi:hypothetical protein